MTEPPGSAVRPEPTSAAPDPGPVPTEESPAGLDLDRLAGHLSVHRPDLLDGAPRARLIPGGRSNLTYRVRTGAREFVLRRPPLGHVLATAHDMAREFRVISALSGTGVPVPAALLLCPDHTVIGAPFYLMEWVPGVVYRDRAQTDRLGPGQRRALALAMMDTLAVLHGVDPASVGLADFGRPEGFLARQVRRWGGQLDQSRSRPLPGMAELRERLAATAPEGANAGRIVHGDYRLDNLLAEAGPEENAEPAGATIRAVLDWEMATLGDPLADLGLLLTYWEVLGDREETVGNPVADGLGPRAGFPSGAELIERYADRSDVDVGPLDWHIALGCFKLAVICEGIHYRHTLGQTVGDGFDRIGEMVFPLVEHGLTAVPRG
ncbi:phosphotransferase family protein [Micromonospora sp. NBC_01796]|uniref:phosphotransferase family protein n=1 Tax=Micromonospora sp. NBC_01796 TaxID=2975987 RepID=UPI002DD8F0AB|nr:phosphotransferase family protein [Micromonospora sp. NBC_01796]WSA86787.1 phosphotransferase family protein [Micromonospora sp. NBC_01796]